MGAVVVFKLPCVAFGGMKLLFATVLLVASAMLPLSVANMTGDQRCSACLYTYQAIDREVTNQTSLHKGKKLSEQKAAARDILSTICDGPAFEGVGFSNGRYVKIEDASFSADLDLAPHHADDLTTACRRLVSQNEKKLVSPLADFRKYSRADVSKNLCTKWTDSCSFDYYKPKSLYGKKTKITKANKCLVDAIALAAAGDFDGSLEKVDCAVVEIPEPMAEEFTNDTVLAPGPDSSNTEDGDGENSSGSNDGRADEDELTVEDE